MAVSRILKRSATYEDLLRVPPPLVAEIVDGDLYTSPRPAPRHAVASSGVGGQLYPPFHVGRGGPGGWIILHEPELHLAEDVAVPDLGGWRRERLPVLPETAFFAVAPDWVCEVVSPGTESLDRARKLPLYARHGVAHAWLVNPLERTLEVYRREGEFWVLLVTHAGDALVRAEPFADVELDLLLLWGETRP
jgi:Uma2 family endonuclease